MKVSDVFLLINLLEELKTERVKFSFQLSYKIHTTLKKLKEIEQYFFSSLKTMNNSNLEITNFNELLEKIELSELEIMLDENIDFLDKIKLSDSDKNELNQVKFDISAIEKLEQVFIFS